MPILPGVGSSDLQRVFGPLLGIKVPAVSCPSRAAARFGIWWVGPCVRIIGLLGFPGDDPALDVDLPAARSGAVHPVGAAHNFVVLPALPIAVLPVAVLVGGDAVSAGKGLLGLAEEGQAVEKLAHAAAPFRGAGWRSEEHTSELQSLMR